NAGYREPNGTRGQVIEQVKATTVKSPAAKKARAAEGGELSLGPQTPMVSVNWQNRGDVNVGQEGRCALLVKNTGKVAAKDIVVEAHFPSSVRLVNAEPFPKESQDHLAWHFAMLAPGEEQTIDITMIPSKRGELATSANVRFTGTAAA